MLVEVGGKLVESCRHQAGLLFNGLDKIMNAPGFVTPNSIVQIYEEYGILHLNYNRSDI